MSAFTIVFACVISGIINPHSRTCLSAPSFIDCSRIEDDALYQECMDTFRKPGTPGRVAYPGIARGYRRREVRHFDLSQEAQEML